MQAELAVADVASRIEASLEVPWDATVGDGLQTGRADAVVRGIVTSWTPSLDVLRRAVDVGANMIVTRERPYWTREVEVAGYSGQGAIVPREGLSGDHTFAVKRSFIEANDLVVWRLCNNWDARPGDPQLQSLAAALGWQSYRARLDRPEIFNLPATTLEALAQRLRAGLNAGALRVVGDPNATVETLVLTHGVLQVPAVQRILVGEVDVIVCGEPVEWEALP